MKFHARLVFCIALALAGCGGGDEAEEAGIDDSAPSDGTTNGGSTDQTGTDNGGGGTSNSGTTDSGAPDSGTPDGGTTPDPGPPATTWYRPAPLTTWQWQLSGEVNTSYDATLYDIDLFDVEQGVIDFLHARGRKVICYFSAGSYEDWRSDKAAFDAAVLGKPLDGWPGERWLDIRSTSVRAVMSSRLDLAVSKKCDGIEPDNVDGYTQDSGFPLSAADQSAYNRFLAEAAHARGLSIGLKNDLDQVSALVTYFDFAVNEQCHVYGECDLLKPFIDAGKAVFNAEYAVADRAALCADAARRRFSTLVLPVDLDDTSRYSCL